MHSPFLFLIASILIQITAVAAPLDTWNNVTPSGVTNLFKFVVYGNGRFIAGADGPVVYTSTDGAAWTQVDYPIARPISALRFANGRFFATASAFNWNYLLESDDGLVWRGPFIDESANYCLFTVIFWQGKYYANGPIERGYVSADGEHWALVDNNDPGPPGTAIGNDTYYISWDADITWYGTPQGRLQPSGVFPRVALAGDTFFRFGAYWSKDLATWTLASPKFEDVLGAIKTPSEYAVVSDGALWSSPDLANWTQHTNAPDAHPQQISIGGSTMGNLIASSPSCAVLVSTTGKLYRSGNFGGSAPVVVGQPSNRVVEAGGGFALSVTAVGTEQLNYQWRKNGVPLDGQTSSELRISNATALDSGDYDVIVSNSLGSTPSHVATVTVNFFGIRTYPGLTVRGDVGQKFEIQAQAAINGTSWAPLTQITLAQTNQVWVDLDSPTNAPRFYRAVAIP